MKLTYNDKQHAYWLDGKRCKGVTSVASMPDNRFNIEQWAERMVVIGMAMSPPLVHRATAHFDERDKVQEIAEEAKTIAKAHEASGRGTADHKITERVDRGLTVIDTPDNRAITAAWTAALDQAGIDIVPEYIERIVVYPDQLIAGRFDRIGRYRDTGRHIKVDVKTGINAVKYPHSTAIQLGLYANAPLMAGELQPGRNGTDWTTDFEQLPDDLHRDHAVVVYLPPEGQARCFRINIAAGWQAAQTICFPTIGWRKRDDLVEEITQLQLVPDLALDPDADRQIYLSLLDRKEWLFGRVETIKSAGHGGHLARLWSQYPNAPTFPKGGPITHAQVDAIAALCDIVESENGIPFGESDPATPTATKSQRKQTA